MVLRRRNQEVMIDSCMCKAFWVNWMLHAVGFTYVRLHVVNLIDTFDRSLCGCTQAESSMRNITPCISCGYVTVLPIYSYLDLIVYKSTRLYLKARSQ